MNESMQTQRLQEELKRAITQRSLYVKELASTTQRFEEKVRELSVVRRIGESLKYTRDVRKVFEVIIDTIIDETQAENCSLMLLNRETGELAVKAARGQMDTESSFYHTSSGTGRSFRIGEGVAGWVALHGEPISIPDISTGEVVRIYPELDERGEPIALPDLPEAQFITSSGPDSGSGRRRIGSLLCLPLVIDNEIVGVVNMSHPQSDAFSSEDERLMTIITDQVAIALSSVQVFDDMQQLNVVLEDEVNKATRELRKANDELQIAYEEIQAASRMKSQFLAHMSHELRTPLNAIIGFSEIMEDQTFGELNEKQNRYVGNILTSSRHLLELINDILDLAKVESGRMELSPDQFLLQDCLAQVIDVVMPLARNKGVEVESHLDSRLGLILADEGRFRQILYNLLSNAIKFTPDGGRVDVNAERIEDDALRVAVRDTGIGIKSEHLELIFSEFRQVEESYARRYEGTGLGLALTRKLVDLHGGSIWVESEEGKGSTFIFVVPQKAPVTPGGVGLQAGADPATPVAPS